jgi:hypothetical protein
MPALKTYLETGHNLCMANPLAHMLWKRILPKRTVYRRLGQKPAFSHFPLTDLENELLRALIRVSPFINTSDEQGREAMQIATAALNSANAKASAKPN